MHQDERGKAPARMMGSRHSHGKLARALRPLWAASSSVRTLALPRRRGGSGGGPPGSKARQRCASKSPCAKGEGGGATLLSTLTSGLGAGVPDFPADRRKGAGAAGPAREQATPLRPCDGRPTPHKLLPDILPARGFPTSHPSSLQPHLWRLPSTSHAAAHHHTCCRLACSQGASSWP